MRIAKLQTLYPSYVTSLYCKRPALSSLAYAEQKRELDFDAFGWADFWGHAFHGLGVEMQEFSVNVRALQEAWCRERGIDFPERDWMLQVARAQVLHHRPDVLFMVDYENFSAQWIRELRAECPSIRLVVGYCGAPFSDPTVFQGYDIVMSDTQELVEKFLELGHVAYRIFHGFDPRVLDRIDLKRAKKEDFTFLGSVVRGNAFHLEREKTLEHLAQHTPLRLYTPAAEVSVQDELRFFARTGAYYAAQALKGVGFGAETVARLPKLARAAHWDRAPLSPVSRKLRPYMQPALYGLEMFQALRDSRATFNCHINVSPRTANNIRLYEATGVATCLVTDWKENITELFEPDREVVTYRSAEECVEKVRWLLENPKECEAIALAGQARTLRDHSWRRKAEELVLPLIRKHLG